MYLQRNSLSFKIVKRSDGGIILSPQLLFAHGGPNDAVWKNSQMSKNC